MDNPLSGKQVQDIVGHPIKIVPFSEMHRYRNVDQLFENNCCLINYLSMPYMGHWVCLVRCGDTITYFDPFGRTIDETIDHLPDYKYESNQDYPHLLKLLYESDYKVRYLDQQMQDKNTNTCGRWAALFMRFRELGDEGFKDIFGDVNDEEIIRFTEALK